MDRRIRIFSLGRKNNIFIKGKECYYKACEAISTIVSSFISMFVPLESFLFPFIFKFYNPWEVWETICQFVQRRKTLKDSSSRNSSKIWPVDMWMTYYWMKPQANSAPSLHHRRKTNCRRGFVHRWNNFQTSGINSIKFLQVYYKCSYCFQTLKQ